MKIFTVLLKPIAGETSVYVVHVNAKTIEIGAAVVTLKDDSNHTVAEFLTSNFFGYVLQSSVAS